MVDISRLIGDIKRSREYAEADSSGERYFELNSREDKAHFDLGYSELVSDSLLVLDADFLVHQFTICHVFLFLFIC